MGTVSDLLALAGAKLNPQASSESADEQPNTDRPANSNNPTFADIGARIGEDNEVLRNLLIETGHQLNTIDNLKETFGKLIEPLGNVLSTLERERADNASSRGALAAIRTSHQTLRAEFQGLEKTSSELKNDNDRLGRDLESALQNAHGLEDEKAKLAGEISAVRTAMAMLVKQLGDETGNVRVLSEEKRILVERTDASDKRIVEMEAEVAHARERLTLLQNDKDTLEAALDRKLAESSRMSRRLTESESALSDSRSRLRQIESNLAVAESERNRLAAACDEANEQRQSEVYALELKLDALRSHADAAEKLAAGVRQSLVTRTEELRSAETKLSEVVVARGQADKKAAQLSVAGEGWEQQTKKLEQTVAELTERYKIVSETLTANESSLVHAREKIKSLIAQVEQIQQDADANRAKTEEDIVQLNATIEHERCERALAEGALEQARSDYARIQQQMAQERATRRIDHQRRIAKTNLTTPS
jgi:crescentin